jgi:uracil-DNA glycosylase family 4
MSSDEVQFDINNLPKRPNSEVDRLLYGGSVPLSQRPQGCEHCPFKGPKVGSRGPLDSPFVIVGESPGANELAKGYPFVGPSGTMLEEVLWRAGLGPNDPEPYITNALLCYPRDKNPDAMINATRCCQQRLYSEIAAFPRKLVLALGASASQSLTNNFGLKITQERGKLYKTDLSEIGCVTTVHPAYVLRNGPVFIPWQRDIKYAVSLFKGVDPYDGKWSPPLYGGITTREQYVALVDRMEQAEWIAADTETSGLHFQKDFITLLGITSNLNGGRYVDIIPTEILYEHQDLTNRLLGNKAKWIWQNGKFDIKFYRWEGMSNARVDHDMMLASYCLNENKGHDLDEIAWQWIGAPKHKDAISDWFKSQGWAKKNWNYAKVPRSILWKYAAYDISKTYHAFFEVYKAVCADPHSSKLYHETLIPASEFLTQVEMNGLTLDPERVVRNDTYLAEALEVPAAKIQAYAQQYLGSPINIGSWQQLKKLLYGAMKLGTMGMATDEDALIQIQRKHDHPIATNLLQWRKLSKARNTYVKSAHEWPGLDSRVHVTFKLHSTTTGRLSSSDPTNLQNWPRDPNIRGQFIAAEGNILVECDLNQAELRCLAVMSGDPTLLDIYTKNEVSIHHITSVAMFGEGYTDDEKMRAKAVNFGIVYGRTAPSLAEEFDISVKEADEYIRVWMGRFPVAAQFIARCRQAPTQQRTLITNFGRKKRWGAIGMDNLRNSENEAANFPHQSTAHDITLRSGIECQPVVRRIWGGMFVNEIHDALYVEVRNDQNVYGPMVAYMQSVMQRIPRECGLTRVPFLAEAKVGTRWGGYKNAKDAKITDAEELSQYMRDFQPTDEHRRIAEHDLQLLQGLC